MQRYPDADIRRASAEALPFDDSTFATTLAQLVVHFMPDPIAGLREMRRVTQPGGVVAACVWDHAGSHGPLAVFWDAVHELDREARDGSDLAGTREGHLGELFGQADLLDIEESSLTVVVECTSFEEWWEPFTLGVGPAGSYTAGLDPEQQIELRELCRRRLSTVPVVISARAWAAKGRA
jgi:SAM-dependent methyltransferase